MPRLNLTSGGTTNLRVKILFLLIFPLLGIAYLSTRTITEHRATERDAQELEARLRIGRRIVAMQAELQVRATRDPLTGAWNRRASTDALTRELERARRTGGSVAAILADIDHFKLVNDENGHLADDDVLCEFVRRLNAAVRPYDAVGRYGGEEFLVALPDCDEAMATGVAERMRASVDGTPFSAAGRSLAVTASFGVAAARFGETLDGLLARVDEALYNAKNQGRNRVVMRP